jgi:hypothetical protein
MTENLQGALQYSWVLILCHGRQRDNLQCQRSSTETEYKAPTNATAKVMWVQSLLQELGVRCPPATNFWCDNMGAKYQTKNPIFHGRMKHVKIDYHFVRQKVSQELLEVACIASGDQVEDGFTKALLFGFKKISNTSLTLHGYY